MLIHIRTYSGRVVGSVEISDEDEDITILELKRIIKSQIKHFAGDSWPIEQMLVVCECQFIGDEVKIIDMLRALYITEDCYITIMYRLRSVRGV